MLATAQLTDGKRYYYSTNLWDLVRAKSRGGRTFNPMTAWTYSSGQASEKKIVYADANIVASHCYTILGWAYRSAPPLYWKYIILRNPWGKTEATTSTLSGTAALYDISWWLPINLALIDGTFAITNDAFKRYFAGMGMVE